MSSRQRFLMAFFALTIGFASLHASDFTFVVTPNILINVDEKNIKIDEDSQTVTLLLSEEDITQLSTESDLSNFQRMRQIIAEEWNMPDCNLICENIQGGDFGVFFFPNNRTISSEILSGISPTILNKTDLVRFEGSQSLDIKPPVRESISFGSGSFTIFASDSMRASIDGQITRKDEN